MRKEYERLYERYPIGTVLEIQAHRYSSERTCLAVVAEPKGGYDKTSEKWFLVEPEIPFNHGRYRATKQHSCSEDTIVRVVKSVTHFEEDLFTL